MPHIEYSITVQALTAGGTKEGPRNAPSEMDTEQIMSYLPHVHVSVILFMLSLYLTLKDHAFWHSHELHYLPENISLLAF